MRKSRRQAPERKIAARSGVFERGPVLQALFGSHHHGIHFCRVAIAVVLAGWLPILVLTGTGALAGAGGVFTSFLRDVKLHANFLVAAPVLVVAYVLTARQLSEVVERFARDGIVPQGQRKRFRDILSSAQHLLSNIGVGLAIIALAYSLSLAAVLPYRGTLSGWHLSAGGQLSMAGWWHLLISLPLFTGLVLGWLWRLLVWAWLLSRIARIDLSLMPAHPDRAAGLGFVGYSLRALAPVGFAIGIVGAGVVADGVLRGVSSLTSSLVLAAVMTGFSLAVCALPLVAFMPKLLGQWWHGVFAYDALAFRFARPFDRRWISGAKSDRGILETPDFSALTDLSQAVANVHAIRPVPIDGRSAALFAAATLVPFVPAFLLKLPPGAVLEHLRSLLV